MQGGSRAIDSFFDILRVILMPSIEFSEMLLI